MRSSLLRTSLVAAAVAAVAALGGCSSSSSSSTTTTTSGSSTTSPVSDLPATGSVDGYILSVTSSPRTGKVGATTITAQATLKGTVSAGTLRFEVTDAPSADKGKPASDQSVKVGGAGRFTIPKPFHPTKAGHWAVTVTYTPNEATTSALSVSGEPPVAGSQPPFPQLVTVVTG